ncbi:hypothetical protein BDW74DRAFT_180402 [Aspergillus multicolor]|uniref:uncharacterized protein n=1 Tax=Aspergillus multicolor TaxID=41759 RepID=UPI003CCE0BAF
MASHPDSAPVSSSRTDEVPKKPRTKLIGCLLDVSGSMRNALDSGEGDGRATERFRAVLNTALRLAQTEYRQDPHARMFIGVFGLDSTENGGPHSVDLCAVIEELLSNRGDGNDQNGHDRLVALANQENRAHIAQYIRTKLTDHQARIVHLHLQRHPEQIREFVDTIPTAEEFKTNRTQLQAGGWLSGAGIAVGAALVINPTTALPILVSAALAGGPAGGLFATHAEDHAVDNSDALKLARRICNEWLQDFTDLAPRPVDEVVRLLERLQQPPVDGTRTDTNSMLDTLRPYMYGKTPMRDALRRATAVFNQNPSAKQRILLLISDGLSTDGDPVPVASDLKDSEVTIATIYLTDDSDIETNCLYDRAIDNWSDGQRNLFEMAAKVSSHTHPIPVFSSMHWTTPLSGECALYVQVCSATVLNQFCELLLSARFGSADALLEVVGRVRLDKYIDGAHDGVRRQPSDQGEEGSCYAHAIAAALHMALRRIRGRQHGYPKIEDIREEILRKFPWEPHGQNTKRVLTAMLADDRYRPLQFNEVDVEGARRAVLSRRPVLATFRLSQSGWDTFSNHFDKRAATRMTVLTRAHMASHHSLPDNGGHAVLLIRCGPDSLTFLNSWGRRWGDNGSFSVEDHTVLELDDPSGVAKLRFYDIYWQQKDLTEREKRAYSDDVARLLQKHAGRHPTILELEMACPLCRSNAPIANFTGSLRQARCPNPDCAGFFVPEAGYLAQALYARAGLDDVEL